MAKRRDLGAERKALRSNLLRVKELVGAALDVDGGLVSSPQTRRAQTLKVKMASRLLHQTHTAILLGKGRSR